jgi:hypothetical protein
VDRVLLTDPIAAAEEMLRMLAGKRPMNLVNPAALNA